MIDIVETREASRELDRLLDPISYGRLLEALSENPDAGPVLRGGGGVRKLRWARTGAGKSGGLRVIHYRPKSPRLWIVSAYSKSEKAELTRQELAAIRAFVKSL